MRNTLRYSFATAFTAGLVVTPIAAAYADTVTDGSGGVGSGNQINVPVDIEADLCGNSLAVLGISEAECTKVSEALYESSGQSETDGSGGVASGNQLVIPVDAALDACGNSAAVGGVSEADCVEVVEKLEEEVGGEASDTLSTDGSGGVGSGNQIDVPVDAAIDICGNSVAVLGGSSAKCNTVINVIQASDDNSAEGEDGDSEGDTSTGGSGGVASGNQVNVPVNAAVDICGNAVSVLGVAEAQCLETIAEEEPPEDGKEEVPEDDGPGEVPEEEPEEPPREEEPGDDGKDEDPADDGASEAPADDQKAPEEAAAELPVTGGALTGLVAAGLAAVGAGGAGLYFTRKRKVAAVGAED
ncbi:chaplin [Nocardiopsis salina]|uniref:chaplin n=1 Tax=Nocardiopsis salina TaxID=245836 RepID=UPI00034621B1|nr:chaplin [Nocardiopsis salina]